MSRNQRTFYFPHRRVTFDNDIVNPVTGEVTYPASMTKQEFVAECDINNILIQYKRTGMLNHISAKAAQGVFMDLPDPLDFQEANNIALRARDAFDALPSKIRRRFNEDPEAFLAFCADPSNLDEMRSLGIAIPAPAPEGGPLKDSPKADGADKQDKS